MGQYSKNRAEDLPDSLEELCAAALWPPQKYAGNAEYHFRACKKAVGMMTGDFKRGAMDAEELRKFVNLTGALAACYREGKGCEAKPESAFASLQIERGVLESFARANRLSPELYKALAQVWREMAGCYAGGCGCERSGAEAMKLFRMAYDYHEKSGGDRYGISRRYLLLDMIGGWPWPVQYREAKARALYLTASGGDAFSRGAEVLQDIELLERMDYRRLGRDPESDFSIFRDAAGENAYAMYRMGHCYREGKGVARDSLRAFECMERASRTLLGAAQDIFFVTSDLLKESAEPRFVQEIRDRSGNVAGRIAAREGELRSKYTAANLRALYEALKGGGA